ncbi:MAG: WYL domain-containing protein, partial [Lachnospiraceae bacterium]|nr:WYL domain-containing protein [Lachnospiraceae bacterium]
KRVLHYRVDLMSDIEIAKDDEGKNIPIEVTAFEGLPICNAYWDPEKYMAEHINMAFDEPRDIRIKIEETGYTLIHDWFGDHYSKVDSVTETDETGGEKTYDIVTVKTSPYMIVHWAMQYGTVVEILDEEIREQIKKEMEGMIIKYGK